MDKSKIILTFLIPLLIFFDQLTKSWALVNLFNTQKIIQINKFLNLVPVWNKGISFGIFSNITNINSFMIVTTSIIILVLVVWFLKDKNKNIGIFLFFIISGAIGNLIDRFKHEAVIDFIDIHVKNIHWPAFNLADSYITIGVFFYLYTIFAGDKINNS